MLVYKDMSVALDNRDIDIHIDMHSYWRPVCNEFLISLQRIEVPVKAKTLKGNTMMICSQLN